MGTHRVWNLQPHSLQIANMFSRRTRFALAFPAYFSLRNERETHLPYCTHINFWTTNENRPGTSCSFQVSALKAYLQHVICETNVLFARAGRRLKPPVGPWFKVEYRFKRHCAAEARNEALGGRRSPKLNSVCAGGTKARDSTLRSFKLATVLALPHNRVVISVLLIIIFYSWCSCTKKDESCTCSLDSSLFSLAPRRLTLEDDGDLFHLPGEAVERTRLCSVVVWYVCCVL